MRGEKKVKYETYLAHLTLETLDMPEPVQTLEQVSVPNRSVARRAESMLHLLLLLLLVHHLLLVLLAKHLLGLGRAEVARVAYLAERHLLLWWAVCRLLLLL